MFCREPNKALLFFICLKTTYVGREKEAGLEATGLNQMGKTLCVSGARIAYSIWEVEGNTHIHYLLMVKLQENISSAKKERQHFSY